MDMAGRSCLSRSWEEVLLLTVWIFWDNHTEGRFLSPKLLEWQLTSSLAPGLEQLGNGLAVGNRKLNRVTYTGQSCQLLFHRALSSLIVSGPWTLSMVFS